MFSPFLKKNIPLSFGKFNVSEAFINLIFGNSVLIFSIIIMQMDHDNLWKGKEVNQWPH